MDEAEPDSKSRWWRITNPKVIANLVISLVGLGVILLLLLAIQVIPLIYTFVTK